MKTQEKISVRTLVKAFTISLPQSQHLPILQEFHSFSGIFNFAQTIRDLISIDQMHIFGISQDMQLILKCINNYHMLGNIYTITKSFQKEYENIHNRVVVIVSLSENQDTPIEEISQFIATKISQPHDIIFKIQSNPGITIQFQGSTIEYTPESILKLLKIA
jgi:F0F1-type ATP synthase delta subunit